MVNIVSTLAGASKTPAKPQSPTEDDIGFIEDVLSEIELGNYTMKFEVTQEGSGYLIQLTGFFGKDSPNAFLTISDVSMRRREKIVSVAFHIFQEYLLRSAYEHFTYQGINPSRIFKEAPAPRKKPATPEVAPQVPNANLPKVTLRFNVATREFEKAVAIVKDWYVISRDEARKRVRSGFEIFGADETGLNTRFENAKIKTRAVRA